MMKFLFRIMILTNILELIAFNDAPFNFQISFQDPATPVMSGIIFLHDYIWGYLIFILIFVTWMLCRILILFKENDNKAINPIVQHMGVRDCLDIISCGYFGIYCG